jgi:hypothetical protein
LAARPPGLEPDEHLLARAPVSFRGAAATSARTTLVLGSARKRLDSYFEWRTLADVAGFSTTGPEMVLGLTDHGLVVWNTSFWFGAPRVVTARIPLSNIHDAAAAHHGIVTGLAIAFKSGAIVEVEAIRGRKLRRLASELRRQLADGTGDSVAS